MDRSAIVLLNDRAKVSVATVSNVLNDKETVNPTIRVAVLRIVEWRTGGLLQLISTLTLTLTLRAALISYEATHGDTAILDLLDLSFLAIYS